ncbi:MAG: hypothetical protein HYR76_13885 [Ignavibacteria bacterium]|nr:hypothetical protein [Ignavibacteria bacterium]
MKQHACGVGLLAFAVLMILVAGGCKTNSTESSVIITPITDNLFPLVAGHIFEYTGYLVDTNKVDTPVPGIPPGAYKAKWTLLPGPSDTWLIQDSTTVGATVSTRFLQIRKDTTSGDFAFRQTLGPFYRRFGVTYTDTTIWVWVARPSMGIGNTWLAFDTTVTGHLQGQTGAVGLQIFGRILGQESITDSSSVHTMYQAYKVRTWRKITATIQGLTVTVQDDATTALLWLVKDIGPVQVNIAGDTENYGHFRVLISKNF